MPPYLKRGNELEARYDAYTKRLASAHKRLAAAIAKDAPELKQKLNPDAPKPVTFGYQILPRILPDAGGDAWKQERGGTVAYSWNRTDRFISEELPRLEEIESHLGILNEIEKSERAPVLFRMIEDFQLLQTNQAIIDEHIKYNRFWQAAVAKDPARFDRLTVLHDATVEYKEILSELNQKPGDKNLLERARIKRELIDSETNQVVPESYIRVEQPKPTTWIIKVPLYTDITEQAFLAEVKRAIEDVWRLDANGKSWHLEVELRKRTPAAIYKPGKPPSRGEHIDLTAHEKHFPFDGAILTTGSNTTYAIPGRYIVLGPQPVARRVIAHEFGHLLGFADNYFRGYRKLGSDGFEILEIVPDLDDLMSAPASGVVRAVHFERLVSANRRESSPVPAAALLKHSP